MRVFLISVLALLLLVPIETKAEEITLNTPETLEVPVAHKLNWTEVTLKRDRRQLIVRYQYLDASDSPIRRTRGEVNYNWVCQDVEDDPATDNAQCTMDRFPWECCTGPGTGNCDETDTCFSDIFQFEIRAQDVGLMIGKGLRDLIWNKMKTDPSVISPGNDGSFGD